MLSVIGLGLAVVGLLLLAHIERWLQRRPSGLAPAHPFLTDWLAMLISSLLIVGGSMVFVDIVESWSSGHLAHALTAVVAVVILAAVARRASSWGRRQPA